MTPRQALLLLEFMAELWNLARPDGPVFEGSAPDREDSPDDDEPHPTPPPAA